MSAIIGDIVKALYSIAENHPRAMAALIGAVSIAAAMWLAPRIIVATESLINIRSRLKDPDDWASEDSFLRTSDPVLWRQNLVFNRLCDGSDNRGHDENRSTALLQCSKKKRIV